MYQPRPPWSGNCTLHKSRHASVLSLTLWLGSHLRSDRKLIPPVPFRTTRYNSTSFVKDSHLKKRAVYQCRAENLPFRCAKPKAGNDSVFRLLAHESAYQIQALIACVSRYMQFPISYPILNAVMHGPRNLGLKHTTCDLRAARKCYHALTHMAFHCHWTAIQGREYA